MNYEIDSAAKKVVITKVGDKSFTVADDSKVYEVDAVPVKGMVIGSVLTRNADGQFVFGHVKKPVARERRNPSKADAALVG